MVAGYHKTVMHENNFVTKKKVSLYMDKTSLFFIFYSKTDLNKIIRAKNYKLKNKKKNFLDYFLGILTA